MSNVRTSDALIYEGQAWGSVPLSVFSVAVSAPARLVLAYLWTYVNPHLAYSAWPAQGTIARALGIPERTLRRHLDELEDARTLQKDYRVHVDPDWRGNPAARVYRLVLPEPVNLSKSSQPATHGRSGPATHGRSDRPPMAAEHIKGTDHQNTCDDVRSASSGDTARGLLEARGVKGKNLEVLSEIPVERILEVLAAIDATPTAWKDPAAVIVSALSKGYTPEPPSQRKARRDEEAEYHRLQFAEPTSPEASEARQRKYKVLDDE